MGQTHHQNLSNWMHKAQKDLRAVIIHLFSSAEILAAFLFPEHQSPFCYDIQAIVCSSSLKAESTAVCLMQ